MVFGLFLHWFVLLFYMVGTAGAARRAYLACITVGDLSTLRVGSGPDQAEKKIKFF
jgi:hypothetical protein